MIFTKNKAGYEFGWPEIFETEDISDRPDAALCADGLSAWGCCMSGASMPESFGRVMAKLALKLNILGTVESFMEKAKEYKDQAATPQEGE